MPNKISSKISFLSGRRDYEVDHFEHGKRESCVSDCSSYGDDPYCAGGKTYKNKCLMYNAVCTDGINPGTKGACGMQSELYTSCNHGYLW